MLEVRKQMRRTDTGQVNDHIDFSSRYKNVSFLRFKEINYNTIYT